MDDLARGQGGWCRICHQDSGRMSSNLMARGAGVGIADNWHDMVVIFVSLPFSYELLVLV